MYKRAVRLKVVLVFTCTFQS